MAKYLSVQQYKDEDSGIDLSGINDLSLARHIARAETAIDLFMKFDMKVGGFEPHQVWFEQKWDDKKRQIRFPSHPIPVQSITRYRIQISNLSTDGSGFYATISPSDAVIAPFAGYVEIVPLQAITYSLSPVILQLGLSCPLVQMDCLVSFYIAIFGETLINTGDNLNYQALRGFWASSYQAALHIQPNQLPAVPPVVYSNGSIVSSSNYTVNYTEGRVTFGSVQSTSAVITVDYTATIPDSAREAAVRQVTYLLQQRALNKQGLGGLDIAKSGDQQIQRIKQVRGVTRVEALCEDAAACLMDYAEIAIA
jgi:hypothetical protein